MKYSRTILIACALLAAWYTARPARAEDAPPPPPAPPALKTVDELEGVMPNQVSVSAKIVEFQTTKGVETGLSAYFAKRDKVDFWGVVTPGNDGLVRADVTFPTSVASGITVFLDRLHLTEGDVEVVLQALANENRAFILSRPKAMVMVGTPYITRVETASRIPYERTVVVGAVAQQITEFKDTGVVLELKVPEVIDDDGDWSTTHDQFIRLDVAADVREEGQRLVVTLDDQLAGGTLFNLAANQIEVPEFVARSIRTSVWVKSGQVLMLGGLYRNTKSKTLTTVPWLTQTEDIVVSAAERLVPGNFLSSPIAATIGNRAASDGRRELVFFIKSEIWRPSFTVADEFGLTAVTAGESIPKPTDIITGVGAAITEGLRGASGTEGEDVRDSLGTKE